MTWTRRRLLTRALAWAPIGLSGVWAGLGCAPSSTLCYDPDLLSTPERALRTARGYAERSPHGDAKQCRGCEFFRPARAEDCGRCQILGGPVSASGHCDSWSEAT